MVWPFSFFTNYPHPSILAILISPRINCLIFYKINSTCLFLNNMYIFMYTYTYTYVPWYIDACICFTLSHNNLSNVGIHGVDILIPVNLNVNIS